MRMTLAETAKYILLEDRMIQHLRARQMGDGKPLTEDETELLKVLIASQDNRREGKPSSPVEQYAQLLNSVTETPQPGDPFQKAVEKRSVKQRKRGATGGSPG